MVPVWVGGTPSHFLDLSHDTHLLKWRREGRARGRGDGGEGPRKLGPWYFHPLSRLRGSFMTAEGESVGGHP